MVEGGLGGKHLRIVAAAAKTSKSFHVFINSLTKKPKKKRRKKEDLYWPTAISFRLHPLHWLSDMTCHFVKG